MESGFFAGRLCAACIIYQRVGNMRKLNLAFGFLTRIPMPALADYHEDELSRSSHWFPFVGMCIGLLLSAAAWLGLHSDPWLAALFVMLFWVGITGGLHLDGVADLSDGLGAAHRNHERFLQALKDPHIGSFGAIALFSILITKLVGSFVLLAGNPLNPWPWMLISAWARLGSLVWSHSLTSLAAGSGERFSWRVSEASMWFWGAGLFVLGWCSVSFGFSVSAVLALAGWRYFLKWRLGGMTGDCLGAGIEYVECVLLIVAGFI